jgi:hypothetical protein
MRKALLVALLATVLAAPASATVIDHGTITVNRGVNGATIGMTRAQVAAALGRPDYTNRNGLMEYSDPSYDGGGIFDIYLGHRSHRVNGIQIAFEGGFKLQDGNRVFRRGAIRRLFRHYGARVHRNPIYQGTRSYSIYGRFHGRKVLTNLSVAKYKRSARALEVYVGVR